jgi:hypothetical protein
MGQFIKENESVNLLTNGINDTVSTSGIGKLNF